MKITIHEEKISHLTFHGKKKGRSRVTKIPFTTLTYRIGVPNTPLSMKTRSLLGDKWYTLIYILDQRKTKHSHTQANHHVLTFPAGITIADQNV